MLKNVDTYTKANELIRICRSGVRKAVAENRRLGMGNVYVLNGECYYELPNGDYSRTHPQPTG